MSDSDEEFVPLPPSSSMPPRRRHSDSGCSRNSEDSDDNSLPLPPPRTKNSDNDSDMELDKIPTPQGEPMVPPDLSEIPYPEPKEDPEDIPLPPDDSSKYSPSQAAVCEEEEESLGSSSDRSKLVTSSDASPVKKSALNKVLDPSQAKKRLMAFSSMKLQAAVASSNAKKPSNIKGVTVFSQSSKDKEKESKNPPLAIAAIKEEETKLREILAMNTILSEKLKQVNAISGGMPKPPPVTAVVNPTVVTSSTEQVVESTSNSGADRRTEEESFNKKTSSSSRHLRKKHNSSSSRSRSRSPDSSLKPRPSRRSRSRSHDKFRTRRKDRGREERDRYERRSGRRSRSKSKERNRDKRRRSRERERRRSKSRSVDRDRHRKHREEDHSKRHRVHHPPETARKTEPRKERTEKFDAQQERLKQDDVEDEYEQEVIPKKKQESMSPSPTVQREEEKRPKRLPSPVVSHSKSGISKLSLKKKDIELKIPERSRSPSFVLEKDSAGKVESSKPQVFSSKLYSLSPEASPVRSERDKYNSEDEPELQKRPESPKLKQKVKDKEEEVGKSSKKMKERLGHKEKEEDRYKKQPERKVELKKEADSSHSEDKVERPPKRSDDNWQSNKVRCARMPKDWRDFLKHQYEYPDIRRLWSELVKSSSTDSKSEQPTPLSKPLSKSLKSMEYRSVERVNGEKWMFPTAFLRTTRKKPQIHYGMNPLTYSGYYKARERIMDEEDESEILKVMTEIMEQRGSTGDENMAHMTSQQWYATTEKMFCPARDNQEVIISHLYSDEDVEVSPTSNSKSSKVGTGKSKEPHKKSRKEKKKEEAKPVEKVKDDHYSDSDSEDSARIKTTSKGGKLTSKQEETKQQRVLDPHHDDDSMDSIPSPMLKKKYDSENEHGVPTEKTKSTKSSEKGKYDKYKNSEELGGDSSSSSDSEKERALRKKLKKQKKKKKKRLKMKEKESKKHKKRKQKSPSSSEAEDEVVISDSTDPEEELKKRSKKRKGKQRKEEGKKKFKRDDGESSKVATKSKETTDSDVSIELPKKKRKEDKKKAKKKKKVKPKSSSSSSSTSSTDSDEEEPEVKAKDSKSKKRDKDRDQDGSDRRRPPGGGSAGSSSHRESGSSRRDDARDRDYRSGRDSDRRNRDRGRNSDRKYGKKRSNIDLFLDELEEHLELRMEQGTNPMKNVSNDALLLEGKDTRELLHAIDDDDLVLSVLKNENISADALLQKISAPEQTIISRKRGKGKKSKVFSSSWSDDSEYDDSEEESMSGVDEKTSGYLTGEGSDYKSILSTDALETIASLDDMDPDLRELIALDKEFEVKRNEQDEYPKLERHAEEMKSENISSVSPSHKNVVENKIYTSVEVYQPGAKVFPASPPQVTENEAPEVKPSDELKENTIFFTKVEEELIKTNEVPIEEKSPKESHEIGENKLHRSRSRSRSPSIRSRSHSRSESRSRSRSISPQSRRHSYHLRHKHSRYSDSSRSHHHHSSRLHFRRSSDRHRYYKERRSHRSHEAIRDRYGHYYDREHRGRYRDSEHRREGSRDRKSGSRRDRKRSWTPSPPGSLKRSREEPSKESPTVQLNLADSTTNDADLIPPQPSVDHMMMADASNISTIPLHLPPPGMEPMAPYPGGNLTMPPHPPPPFHYPPVDSLPHPDFIRPPPPTPHPTHPNIVLQDGNFEMTVYEEYQSPPRRLSLDERLEVEMGIRLKDDPKPAMNGGIFGSFHQCPPKLQFGGQDPLAPGKLMTNAPSGTRGEGPESTWTADTSDAGTKDIGTPNDSMARPRPQSQVLQVGNVIQIVPAEQPTAPITIMAKVSYSDKKTDRPTTGTEGVPKRVVTIKVPVVPFTMPVVNVVTQEEEELQAAKLMRKLCRLKRKRKLEKEAARKKRRMELMTFGEKRTKEGTELTEMTEKEGMVKVDVEDGEKEELLKEVEKEKDVESTERGEKEEEKAEEREEEKECDVIETKKSEVLEAEETGKIDGEVKEESNSEETQPGATAVKKKVEVLPPPEKGILVVAGFRERIASSGQKQSKSVKFRDGIQPGNGSSSSGGEEMASPPPPAADSVEPAPRPKPKKLKRKKTKVEVKAADNEPPRKPSTPYPFCPPGVLYQVCPQYAVLYAQAMAEKGLDIVFEPTNQPPVLSGEGVPSAPAPDSQNTEAESITACNEKAEPQSETKLITFQEFNEKNPILTCTNLSQEVSEAAVSSGTPEVDDTSDTLAANTPVDPDVPKVSTIPTIVNKTHVYNQPRRFEEEMKGSKSSNSNNSSDYGHSTPNNSILLRLT